MTIPRREDLAPNEVALSITSDRLDEQGRVQFTAHWLDDYLPPSGVRAQVFHTNLADFVHRQHRTGHRVTALDEHTHKLLDSLNLDLA